MQQVVQARAAGTLLEAGELGQAPAPMVSLKTRGQVLSELLRVDPRWAYANGYQPG